MNPLFAGPFMGGQGASFTPTGGTGGSASSKSDLYSQASFNNSGWTVATGGGNATSAPINWQIVALIVVGALLWKRIK